MRSIAVLVLVFVVVNLQGCVFQDSKINGVSFVANKSSVDSTHIIPVKRINANYAAVMPFGFISNKDSVKVVFNSDWQWYGETIKGGRNYIEQLHKHSIKVMLKPQLWIRHGEFTGYLKMKTEEQWIALENTYKDFILTYAKLAQQEQVALFCIGTELEQFVVNRPKYWKQLIEEIRAIYSGKLTYASNWDEYKKVPFWDALDYIGIDGYFPVSDLKTPTLKAANNGWESWKVVLKSFSNQYKKQIVFTEWGYRSMDYAGKEPWVADRHHTSINLEAQKVLTQAVFDNLYPEPWFAGGFVWKWFIHHERSGGEKNNRFTPQNKPAENVLKEYFSNY